MTPEFIARRPELLALKKVASECPLVVVTRQDIMQVAMMLGIPGIIPAESTLACLIAFRKTYHALCAVHTNDVKAAMIAHGIDAAYADKCEWTADQVVLRGNFPEQDKLAATVFALAHKPKA